MSGRRPFAVCLAAALLLFLVPAAVFAAEMPAAERERIERLLRHIEGLDGARFVRNGREYDGRTAAAFLRRKWAARRTLVTSAETFIDRIASASSTTGRLYLIRFPDGREIPSGDYLRAAAG